MPLIEAGPFAGLDTATDTYYLDKAHGSSVNNVDISTSISAFTSAYGRTLFGTLAGMPAGYTIQCIAPMTAFAGETPNLTVKRVYVISAVNANNTAWWQAFYEPATARTVVLPTCNPFTQAVQFAESLYTNGNQKIYFINVPAGQTNLGVDLWQVQVNPIYAFNILGNTVTQAGSAAVQTYQYAITYRRANGWSVNNTSYVPDLGTFQESSPIFSTPVTITAGQQPAISVAATVGGLFGLVNGVGTGPLSEQSYGCLYRWSTLQPVYQFVDYLINLPQGTGNSPADPCFIDTVSDASISANATLIFHHDPPPTGPQLYPGPTSNAGTPLSIIENNQQVSFNFNNPGFVAKYKNRAWVFGLYPTFPVVKLNTIFGPAISDVPFQPQLWYSDYGTPWSFNDSQQVELVGMEDTPGNGYTDNNIVLSTAAPWGPGLLEDTPMNLASTGSELVMFKSQTTWILVGDSPSEFLPRRAFDIGCLSTNSVVEGEGGVFWLAPQGVYFFSGQEPSYIGEKIRGRLDQFTWAQKQAAVGSYRNRAFYLSLASITFVYYTPTQEWYTLPYGTTAATQVPYNQNLLIFAGPNGTLHQVAANASSDLGQPIVSQWVTGVTDSNAPGQIKDYQNVVLSAPLQQGTVQVQLFVDGVLADTFKWDLSVGQGGANAHVGSLKQTVSGYTAYAVITTTTVVGSTVPINIRKCTVNGVVKNALVPTADAGGLPL